MLFYSGDYFTSYTDEHLKRIKNEIYSESDAYILNVNVDDYASHISEKYSLNTPEIFSEKVYVDTVEKNIPGSRFPRYDFFISDPDKLFLKQVILYYIPFTGDISLLQLRPQPYILKSYNARIDTQQKCIIIEIINFYNDPERIKQQYELEASDLLDNYVHIRKNCTDFNDRLPSIIKTIVEDRKQQLLEKNNLMASLGVPVKKKENVPQTFSIPNPKLKEQISVKPIVHQCFFKPEPALDDINYKTILRIINDFGKNFERLPSTYKGKTEEDIRDHILLVLDPNFQLGSATGETFNKIGKTDILLRYDSNIIFIAECKYWKGVKAYHNTIDQLLGYLTWRNSKTAIINFVQNSEFSEVLEKIKESTKVHSNFLKEVNSNDESWFNYKFHINGDRNREIDLAVISFHLPKIIKYDAKFMKLTSAIIISLGGIITFIV